MTSTTQRIVASADDAGKRIDRFLAQSLKRSRAQVQRLIKAEAVFVHGLPVTAHYQLRAGDIITVKETRYESNSYAAPIIPVLAETDDYIVVNKPAGVLVHATTTSQEPTLVDWARQYCPNIVTVGDINRPGIVHRLDRGASGVLVLAKTPALFQHLKTAFRERQVIKKYLALVVGRVEREEGSIDFRIARSRTRSGRVAARPASAEGREAKTLYEVREYLSKATLLSVRILTGRTHQIRAHLFALGHPVVGDTLYRLKKMPSLPALDRLFLHAEYLAFSDLSGEWQEFSAPLPEDLQQYWGLLRKSHH